MDAYTLMKEYACRLCGRLPSADADIVLAEDGFFYDRACMNAYIKMTKVGYDDTIISPVTNESIGSTLITPKTIKSLIRKLIDDESNGFGESQNEDVISEVKESNLSDGDLLARRALDIYFGRNNNTKNQALGYELLVEAACDGGSAFAAYKLGSFYCAGVHGFRVDAKKAKKWLAKAKACSSSLGPSETENIESYLNTLPRD